MENVRSNVPVKIYAVVNNIPASHRSADLRRFFSQFVETGAFDCFHFRHRPEKQQTSTESNSTTSATPNREKDTFCCIIRVSELKFIELLRTYHQRNWQDDKGVSMSTKCLISRLKTSQSSSTAIEFEESCAGETTDVTGGESRTAAQYKTRGETRQIPTDREEFHEEDLLKLPELRPPPVMPHGNVGTPTMHFMTLIQECRLPPSIIKKLQLDFPKSKNKGKYGSVPFDYQTCATPSIVNLSDNNLVDETSQQDSTKGTPFVQSSSQQDCTKGTPCIQSSSQQDSAKGTPCVQSSSQQDSAKGTPCVQISNKNTPTHTNTISVNEAPLSSKVTFDYKEKRRLKKLAKLERRQLMSERIEEKMIEFEKAGSESGDDNDTCEEWERHEAMYDDVTNQGRTKDRLFEEEMEVVWEKGGSGLVFYTDAQYWQQKEGDFDEQTADDLDIDMSAYYEDGAGDKDIRDFLTIRQEQRRRRGIEQTDRFSAGIGKFEQYTKGIGRKILEKQGWKEGSGLGSSVEGISDALDNEGKRPRDRKGFGYRGEKLLRGGTSFARKRKANRDVIISTVYDNPADIDPLEPLKRRNSPSYMKHRGRIN